MKRTSLIALTLSLTALIAWGCNSGHNGPVGHVTPELAPADDVFNPGYQTPDAVTPGASDDSDNTLQLGGGTPPVPTPDDGLTGDPGVSGTGDRDIATPKRNCDGRVVFVPTNATDYVLKFNKTNANANNVNRTFDIEHPTYGAVPLTITGGSWLGKTAVLPNAGQFTFAAEGTWEHNEKQIPYSTEITLNWNYSKSTCALINMIVMQHKGPAGNINRVLVFHDGLRLTTNSYAPIEGERSGTQGTDSTGGMSAYWVVETESVETILGKDYTTFAITNPESGFTFRLVWNNTHGVVAVEDPYIVGRDGENRFTFPGYPSR